MENKRILLGITGSAAAFKGVLLASLLRKQGFEIDCILTSAALKFVSETQVSCVTGKPVYSSLFTVQPADPVPHITLTDSIDLFAVVPATADFIGKSANGLADDLLSSAYLACDSPVLMAPSMNTRMWKSAAVACNVEKLRGQGVIFAGPVSGNLACGTEGMGRLMEPPSILEICLDILADGS
jgi:phosphopantothenoylcysteine decarboxylase / phosphopantothenate---cysteine ligase